MVDTPKVELNLGGTWTDVSSYVRYSSRISITRGQQNEGSSSLDNSTCSLTLSNSDGRFSPRNPTSPYYGLLGRNTPLRVSLPGDGLTSLRVWPDDNASQATAPDAAGLGITGDIDIRIEVDADHWYAGDLAGKYETTGSQRSWWFGLETGGRLRLAWSPDGTLASRLTATATIALPTGPAHRAVRVTLDVNNGSGGYTATFYTADTIAGPWTQLGDPTVTTGGTTSIFDSTAPVEVGGVPDLTVAGTLGGAIPGKYIAFELRDGIGGTVVASPDFSAQTAGTTSFDDAQGNTWTVGARAEIIDGRRYRFHGEVASWPPTRDISGKDATVSITAAGVSRRLKQGERTLRSPMFRDLASPERENVVAYWPLEDGEEATQIAGGVSGTPPARITGSLALADYDGWTASDPIPTMKTGAITGTVPAYPATGEATVRMFMYMPGGAVEAETSLLRVKTTGSAATWEIRLLANGNLRTSAWGSDGAAIDDGAGPLNTEVAFNMDARGFALAALELRQDGPDINWRTWVLDFDNRDTYTEPAIGLTWPGTLSGYTVGVVTSVTVGADRGLGEVKLGHLSVANAGYDVAYERTNGSVAAWNGETPIRRMARIGGEEGVRVVPITKGQADDAVTLGDQLNKSLIDLLQEAADTDGGILYEPRDFLGFAYRTRASMYNQSPVLTLSCADHELNEALQPVDDDQRTLNDVTVKRVAGSSVRVEQTTGPMSTQDPPEGVGRYNTSIDLSLEHDGQLIDQAGWRLHLGTVDEARYPKVKIHLAHPAFAADPSLTDAALAVDVGDRIVITDPSADLPPDDISLLVIGYSEVLDQFEHVITYVCQPESPWHVGQVETEGYDRVDTAGSELADGATSTATSLSVATTEGPVWTTDAGDLPFDIFVAGERMTVTDVSGTSSPQTFTVTRSVNGVVKAHTAGSAVTIAEPVYIAL
jgi:hypothetical protein